jgi:hypothetical protein
MVNVSPLNKKTAPIVALLLSVAHLTLSFSVKRAPLASCRETQCKYSRRLFKLAAAEDNDAQVEVQSTNDPSSIDEDNFDAEGFANYLGPYLIAVAASFAVTAGFVKFVLLDY